jgi:N-acetylglutamate synthase-like GNAT family acetyltransferase
MLLVRQGTQFDKELLPELMALVSSEMEKSVLAKKTAIEMTNDLEDGKIFLAFWKEELIGLVSYHDWNQCIEIMTIFVKDDFRRRGIGAYLAKTVYHFLKKTSKKRIVVMPNNSSKSLFLNLGLSPIDKALMNPKMRCACHGCAEEDQFPVCHCHYLEKVDGQNIVIEVTDQLNLDHRFYNQYLYLYKNMWTDAPWFETWTLQSTIEELRTYDDKQALFVLAHNDDRLVGFCTGYFVEKKEMREIAKHEQFNPVLDGYIGFYVAEVGVVRGLREQGIGLKLLQSMMAKARQRGVRTPLIISRTKAPESEYLFATCGLSKTKIADGGDPQRFYWVSR